MESVKKNRTDKDETAAVEQPKPNHTEAIKSQVLAKIGKPPRLDRVEVCKHHNGKYRVNIWEQPEPKKNIAVTPSRPHSVVLLFEGLGDRRDYRQQPAVSQVGLAQLNLLCLAMLGLPNGLPRPIVATWVMAIHQGERRMKMDRSEQPDCSVFSPAVVPFTCGTCAEGSSHGFLRWLVS